MEKIFFIIGAVSAAISVALGAFGAHGLRERLTPQLLEIFETGVRYEIYHAFAILFVAFALTRWQSNLIPLAGWAFVLGTLIFSGSLYLLALTDTRWLGAITQLVGVAFIAGWILLAVGVWQSK